MTDISNTDNSNTDNSNTDNSNTDISDTDISDTNTEIHNAKYNFKEHILNLSRSDNFDSALKEWIQMPNIYKKLQHGKCKCICQRIIKYFYYIYNKITKKYINVGTECYKKFKFNINNNKNINKILKNILDKFAKGEYENIEDLIEYSINVQLRLGQDLLNLYEIYKEDIDKLYMLQSDIEDLIENYNFTDLEGLKKAVIEAINDIKKRNLIEEEENKLILEEERKIDEANARETQEYENEIQNVKIKFEEGNYINLNNKDKFKINILKDYLKKQNNTYIQTYINKYENNVYLYNIIKNILDYKLNCIEKFRIEAENKIKIEHQLLQESKKQALHKELEEIKNINIKKIAEKEVILKEYKINEELFINTKNELNNLLYERYKLLESVKIYDSKISNINTQKQNIDLKKIILDKKIKDTDTICEEQTRFNEMQIIHNKIILYNNNIEKWKLMTDKKESTENDDDYNKRIIYTKNGSLKIKDIVLITEIKIDKNIEQKIRQIKYIEDTNEEYMEIAKPWLINYIDYKDFINFDINTICDLNIKYYILNTKTLQYLRENQNELEFYIRYKLGQRLFPDTNYNHQKHLRFNFDEDIDFNYQDNKYNKYNKYNKSSDNKYILDLFNNFYNDNTISIYTRKGTCFVRYEIIDNEIIDTIDYTGKGTITILIDILNKIEI